MIITGIIIGEINKIFKNFLPGKDPLTKASEAINPKIRDTRVVQIASFKLKRVGPTHSSSIKNWLYQVNVKPFGGNTRNRVLLKDMGTVITEGTTRKVKITPANTPNNILG